MSNPNEEATKAWIVSMERNFAEYEALRARNRRHHRWMRLLTLLALAPWIGMAIVWIWGAR